MTCRMYFYTSREKGKDRTQSYDKSPYTDRQHKNATKNFGYTTIADRLRTVSWGNDSYPTGVVKPVNGILTLPLTTKVVQARARICRYYFTVSWNLICVVSKENDIEKIFKWNNCVNRKEEKPIALIFNLNILEPCSVRLHSTCGTDLGRSVKIATDKIH